MEGSDGRLLSVHYGKPPAIVFKNGDVRPGVKLVRRDGTFAEAGSYADFFWLEPGDVAVFAAPQL